MPRKSETTSTQITAESQQNAISDGIDNFELPKSLVAKIAKVPVNHLPSEFLSVHGCPDDVCSSQSMQSSKKKPDWLS
jgi:hypothetical protein